MVLSHGTWERMFGGDRSIIGRVIRLNGVGFEVIGVMPRAFFDLAEREGRTVDLWLPLRTAPMVMSTFDPKNRASRLLWGVARLKDGVNAAEAEDELDAISTRLQGQFPDTNRGFGVHATRED